MAGEALQARFDLAPEKALAFFRDKGYATSFAWQDVWQAEQDAAFTVAKMMNVDLLRDTRAAVDKALAEGQTFEQFRTGIEGRLVEAGWWGTAEMKDPATGETNFVQLGSPRRLRTIFNTNLKTAYAAGHWQEIQDNKAEAPYLMYDAVGDEATRDEHAAWDGTVLPVDDPWWQTHTPPNGWGCRCGVIQLSLGQAQEAGYKAGDKAPPSKTREYVNPRTGVVEQVPEGIDPGWAYNVGASRMSNVTDQLVAKAAADDPVAGARLMKTLTPAEAKALDDTHRAWVDEVLATPGDAPRSSWRVVGGLSVDDLVFLRERGVVPKSAAITLDSRLMVGPKAARHAAAGDALSAQDWQQLTGSLREPQAVLLDKATGRLHYVLQGGSGRQPRLVVAIDYSVKDRRVNDVRSAFKVDVDALRDTRSFELVRGALK